jgi:hypothetical protein
LLSDTGHPGGVAAIVSRLSRGSRWREKRSTETTGGGGGGGDDDEKKDERSRKENASFALALSGQNPVSLSLFRLMSQSTRAARVRGERKSKKKHARRRRRARETMLPLLMTKPEGDGE